MHDAGGIRATSFGKVTPGPLYVTVHHRSGVSFGTLPYGIKIHCGLLSHEAAVVDAGMQPTYYGGMCTFCEIAAGAVNAHVVFDDADSIAFLDHRPLFPGHSLLIPKQHYETLADLPAHAIEPLFSAARLLAGAIEEAMEAQGTFVAMNNKVSQSVPHLHVHIVPRRRKDGLRGFFWPRSKYRDDAHMESTARLIQDAVKAVSPQEAQ